MFTFWLQYYGYFIILPFSDRLVCVDFEGSYNLVVLNGYQTCHMSYGLSVSDTDVGGFKSDTTEIHAYIDFS